MITFAKGTLPLCYLRSFRLRTQPESLAISLGSNWITLRYKMLLKRTLTVLWHCPNIIKSFNCIMRKGFTLFFFYPLKICNSYLLVVLQSISLNWIKVFGTEGLTATTRQVYFSWKSFFNYFECTISSRLILFKNKVCSIVVYGDNVQMD